MGFQMRRINHDLIGFSGFASQFREYLVEHAHTAPANEPVVDRLVRNIFARCVAPSQPIPDDEDDPADHTPVIHPCDPVRQGKKGLIRRICASESKNKSAMATPPCVTNESADNLIRKNFNGS